ncbi:MAG TPA: hypothetical protein VFZ61_07505 [Polyangiales bacterium]
MSVRAVIAGAAALTLGLPACVEEQRYAIENESVAMTEDTPVAFVNEDDDEIFIVTRDFALPVTPPKNSDLDKLAGQVDDLPFPRAPWLERDDVELELDYTLANLSDERVLASVIIDGRNEFNLYTPGPEDFHQWERRFLLEPKQRVRGSVSELEMDEIAIDLATVVNGAPNSNQVVQFQSQSGRDARVQPYIPARIPGLVGFTAGIMSNQAANIALELSVRVQDHGDRVPKRGEKLWMLPDPTPFVPIAEEEE